MMLMVETFDEWAIPKVRNGYNRYFKEWAEKDVTNVLHHWLKEHRQGQGCPIKLSD